MVCNNGGMRWWVCNHGCLWMGWAMVVVSVSWIGVAVVGFFFNVILIFLYIILMYRIEG